MLYQAQPAAEEPSTANCGTVRHRLRQLRHVTLVNCLERCSRGRLDLAYIDSHLSVYPAEHFVRRIFPGAVNWGAKILDRPMTILL